MGAGVLKTWIALYANSFNNCPGPKDPPPNPHMLSLIRTPIGYLVNTERESLFISMGELKFFFYKMFDSIETL